VSLATGDKLGPYEIGPLIGAGGMGEVYRARDTRLDRTVAIKVSKEKFSERFEREARAVAALNHPNICTLHDVGPNYLVMEYIEGAPLKGPLPLDQALKYMSQICDALDAAHKKNITHRDLKPANILVTKSAGVKLLDFGLARMAPGTDDATVTVAGAVMGTPAYMSPEQWEGKPGDARSDIYALGFVLYEMLTGKRPAPDRSPVNPPSVEAVITTCLAKDPEERWQTAREVKIAVAQSPSVAPVGRPSRERLYWAAIAVLATLLIATLFLSRTPALDQSLTRFAVYPPENAAFPGSGVATVPVPQFVLSPDGRTMAYVAATAGANPMLWLRPMEAVAAHTLPGTENAQDPFWSPDSRWLGFFAEGKLLKIPASGGAVQVITQGLADSFGGSWGPDDTILYAAGTRALFRVSATGGPVSSATQVDITRQERTHRWPQFLPDGRHFLFLIQSPLAERGGVYAASLDGKTKKFLIRSDSNAVYAPPGYLLWVDGDALLAQAFDAEHLELRGQSFTVAEGVGHATTAFSAVSASNTGTLAYAPSILRHGSLTWLDRNGKPQGSTGPEGDYTDFRLSPDEKSLAASLVDPKSNYPDIWLTDLTRGSRSRVTFGPAINASPVWSPDGTRFAFRKFNGGVIEFYQKSAAGGGDEDPLLLSTQALAAGIEAINLVPSDWSPDGQNIICSIPTRVSDYDLWLLPMAGDKKPVRFLASPSSQIHANFSPDGRLVAYSSNESGKFEVFVQTFPLSRRKWQVSTDGGYEPRWRADGREIYYLSEDRKLMAVPVGVGPVFDAPKALFQTRVAAVVHANRTHYVPSRDGQRFLVNTQSGDMSVSPITVVLDWEAGLKK
jgi:Tol biopolymer transport system component/predicted Ser/Thr protein kinase